MMNNIYFLRHCKTAFNASHLISGGENIPIIDKNIDISNLSINPNDRVLIISSPLKRCIQTTYILKKKIHVKTKIILDKRLVEREMGQLQGKSKSAIIIQYPNYFSENRKFKPALTPPDGESFDIFYKRLYSFSQNLSQFSMNYDAIIISSHNQTLKMLYAILFNLKVDDVWENLDFVNGKVTKIDEEVSILARRNIYGMG